MIKLLALDVDGILTNGKKHYDLNGNVISKSFCDLDFTAIKAFKSNGVSVIFVSGDNYINSVVAKNRNIDFYLSRNSFGEMISKADIIKKVAEEREINLQDICFVGDDVFDIDAMKIVGISVCPSNSPDIVKKHSTCVLDYKSGDYLIMRLLDKFVQIGILSFPSVDAILEIERSEKNSYL